METARDEYELRGMLPGLACVEDESGSCQCQRDGRILQLLGGSTSQLFPSSFNLVFWCGVTHCAPPVANCYNELGVTAREES